MTGGAAVKEGALTRDIYRRLFMTTLVVQLVTTLSSLLDYIIPGMFLGENALSAITLTMPLVMLMYAFMDMMSMGGSNLFSIAVGEGDTERAKRYFTATIAGAVLVGLAVALAGLLALDPLVALLGADEALFQMTREVTAASLFFFPVMPAYVTLDFFVRNDGRIHLAMVSNIVFIALNVLIDIWFVGYTDMGVVGAPLASILSALIAVAILSAAFFQKGTSLVFTKSARPADVLAVMKSGSGLTFRQIYAGVTTAVFNNLIMRSAGGGGVVVYTVIVNVMTLASGIFASIRETIQPIVATYSGEKHSRGVGDTMRLAARTGACFCLLVFFALELMPPSWLRLFGIEDAALLAQAKESIRLYAWILPFLCFTEIMSSFYQFIGYPRMTFVILTLKGLLLLLPLGCLGLWLAGLPGLWAGLIATEALASVFCFFYARREAARHTPPLSSFLLLDTAGAADRFAMTVPATEEGAMRCVYALGDFLDARHAAARVKNAALPALEELLMNIVRHNQAPCLIEVQAEAAEGAVLIVRDNGAGFDPTEARERPAAQLGLRMVTGLAASFSYVPTIGYNRVILTF